MDALWEPGYTINRSGEIYRDGVLVPMERNESNMMVKIGEAEYALSVAMVATYMMDGPSGFLAFADRDVFNLTVDNMRWTDEKDAAVQLSLLPLDIKEFWLIERRDGAMGIEMFKRSTLIHKKLVNNSAAREELEKHYWTSWTGKVWSNYISSFMKVRSDGFGYPIVGFAKILVNGQIHRLVATSFVYNPDPETRKVVNHIDGDKKNASAPNLEWVSLSQNSSHSIHILHNKSGPATRVTRYFYDGRSPVSFVSMRKAERTCGLSWRKIHKAIEERSILDGSTWERNEPKRLSLDMPPEEHIAIPGSLCFVYPTMGKIFNTTTKNWLPVRTVNNGYQNVRITINGKTTTEWLHRLIAKSVYGPIPPGHHVNHCDKNPSNNAIDNLEIVTASRNKRHAVENSSCCTNAKVVGFNPQSVELVMFANCRDAADFYAVSCGKKFSPRTIFDAASGKSRHIRRIYFSLEQEQKLFLDYIQEINDKLETDDKAIESLREDNFGQRWRNIRDKSIGCSVRTIKSHCMGLINSPMFKFTSITNFIDEITFWSFNPERNERLIQISK